MNTSSITLMDHRIIKKYVHPIRLEISLILSDMKPRTVQMIAKKLGMDHGKIYYHIKVLEDLKLVHVVKTKKINNITARYYSRVYKNIYVDSSFDITKLPEYQTIKRNSLARMIRYHYIQVVPNADDTKSRTNEDFILHHMSIRLRQKDFPHLLKDLLQVISNYESKNEDDNLYKALLSIALPVNKI